MSTHRKRGEVTKAKSIAFGSRCSRTRRRRDPAPAGSRYPSPARTAAREARRARGQHIGRPKAVDQKNAALAQRMNASGESVSTISATLGVSGATVYRVLAE
jgi:Helix-turn-helix domain of resolvase